MGESRSRVKPPTVADGFVALPCLVTGALLWTIRWLWPLRALALGLSLALLTGQVRPLTLYEVRIYFAKNHVIVRAINDMTFFALKMSGHRRDMVYGVSAVSVLTKYIYGSCGGTSSPTQRLSGSTSCLKS
jgi:hypothetical protein